MPEPIGQNGLNYIPPMAPMGTPAGPSAMLGALFGGAAPSAGLQQMFQAVQDQFGASQDRVNQMFGNANQAGAAFNQFLQAPPPQTSQWGDFAANLGGNISQAIAPQMNGQELARNTIARGQTTLNEQRLARLSALKDNYDRMANAAMEAGNVLEHTKNLTAANRMQAQLEAENTNLRTAAQIKAEHINVTDTIAGNMAVAKYNFEKGIIIERARAGWQVKEGGDPDKLADYTIAPGMMSPAEFGKQRNMFLSEAAKDKTGDPVLAATRNTQWREFQIGSQRIGETDANYAKRLLSVKEITPARPTWPNLMGGRYAVPLSSTQTAKSLINENDTWDALATFRGLDNPDIMFALSNAGVPNDTIARIAEARGVDTSEFRKWAKLPAPGTVTTKAKVGARGE